MFQLLHQVAEQRQRGRVRPVQILDTPQHRLLPRDSQQQVRQRLEGALLLPLR